MKKFLLSLFVGFVGIISFCSSYDVYSSKYTVLTVPGVSTVSFDTGLCLLGTNFGNVYITDYSNHFVLQGVNDNDKLFCFDFAGKIWSDVSVNTNLRIFTGINEYFSSSSSCPSCPTCEDPYTSMECQTQYNLIPVESVDINYCVGNGLCPNQCGSGTDLSGDLQYSNIYINSILHPGEENIFIDIPDYIQWDYSVTTGEFNIYVGSGYDMDYMNSIIKINSYRPTSTDFTDVFVSGLTLIFPYIFLVLLLMFIWKLLKRIFK